MKHHLLTVALAVAFVLVALASGAHRRGAVAGAVISGATAIASIVAIGRSVRGPKPLNRALAVVVVMFMARLVLVVLGVLLVHRAEASIPGFVAGFFAPYFVFAAVEGLYVHSLNRRTGPTA